MCCHWGWSRSGTMDPIHLGGAVRGHVPSMISIKDLFRDYWASCLLKWPGPVVNGRHCVQRTRRFDQPASGNPRPDRRVPKFLVVECLGFESPRGLKVYQQGRCAALRRAPSISINGPGRPFPRHTPAMAKSASTAAVACDEYSAAGRPCHPGIVTRLVTRTMVNRRACGGSRRLLVNCCCW